MSRWRLAVLGTLLLAIALAVGFTSGLTLTRFLFPAGALRPLNTATILTQVQGLAQLVTVKYVMEKVVVLEDVRAYGENRVLLVAHGVAKAGVDLTKLGAKDLELQGRTVRIRLPESTLTDVYLDDDKTEVIEHTTGLFRRFDKGLQQQARRDGLEAIRRAARDAGILADAQQRAELQLRYLFLQLGYEGVEFVR